MTLSNAHPQEILLPHPRGVNNEIDLYAHQILLQNRRGSRNARRVDIHPQILGNAVRRA